MFFYNSQAMYDSETVRYVSSYSIVSCWLVLFGFDFFFSFSNYNNLEQGNFKKKDIKEYSSHLCKAPNREHG